MAKNTKHLRAILEARIDDAIDLLNKLDGDTDFEPECDACEFEDAAGLQHGVPLYTDSEDFELSAYEAFDQRNWSGQGRRKHVFEGNRQ
jgi:hypothetical protein